MNPCVKLPPIRTAGQSRRGATILIVLVLISITLAFSFAMVRTQTVSSQVQRNYDRRAQAKQAAMAGLSIGMRKMCEADWAGVGIDLNGRLGDGLSYLVTFDTGDPTLAPGHPDAAETPYRVTVTSTGAAIAPGDPSQQSTHTIRAVMQLVRRSMQPTPSAWSQVQPYTLYQWNASAGRVVEIEMPSRIEGPVAIQNAIELCAHYPRNGYGEAFAGTIDHVTILGSALSANVIEDLHDGTMTLSGLMGDPSSEAVACWQFEEAGDSLVAQDELGARAGIYDGAQAGAAADNGSGAARFDGLDDQVFVGPVGVYTGKITILARLKIEAFHDAMRIVSSSTSATTCWALSVDGPKRSLKLSVRSWFGGYQELESLQDQLSLDEWIDVAAVYSGSDLTLYINGVLASQQGMVGYLMSTPSANLSLGGRAPGNARTRYLRDLRALHEAGESDQRPFDGPLAINRGTVDAATQTLLEHELGIAINDLTLPGGAPVAHPGQLSQYQLYPGGKFYPVEELAGSISNTQLGPNPLTNPLGLFVCTDELQIHDNVTIAGTILTCRASSAGDIRIMGDNITLQAVDLPPLVGATEPRQLPVAIVNNDFRIESNSSGSLNGLAVTWDEFRFHGGDVATKFSVTGKLIVSEIQLRERTAWDQGSSWWNSRMSEFMRSINWQSPADSRFPDWLFQQRGLDPTPSFHACPATTSTQYHWHDWSKPLFVAHPDDQGLRWDLLDWRDNP